MIIESLLDNDQYKFTMQQALFLLGHSIVPVEYKFKCRTKGVSFKGLTPILRSHITDLEKLRITKEELEYLHSLPYFNKGYLAFLRNFRFDTSYINVETGIDGSLNLRIKGPWYHTILFEVPILAIISQVYASKIHEQEGNDLLATQNGLATLDRNLPDDFYYAEFGTRRRESFNCQNEIISYAKRRHPKNFVGTSNLFFAMRHNLTAIGTMAHEWLMAYQQLGPKLIDSQVEALDAWARAYRGRLGIALSDVINTDTFIKDFSDPYFLKLFDGVREDSDPDPIKFGHKIINMYLYNKIDPKTKTIVFSNSLTMLQALVIHSQLHNLIKLSFGIGTHLTNNSPYALNIVLKMVKCNGEHVAKLSNEPGKIMCESPDYVKYLKSVFKVN